MKVKVILLLIFGFAFNTYSGTIKNVELYPGYNLKYYNALNYTSPVPLTVNKNGIEYTIVSKYSKYILGRNLILFTNALLLSTTQKSVEDLKKINIKYEFIDKLLENISNPNLDNLIKYLRYIILETFRIVLGVDKNSEEYKTAERFLVINDSIKNIVKTSLKKEFSRGDKVKAVVDALITAIFETKTMEKWKSWKILVINTANAVIDIVEKGGSAAGNVLKVAADSARIINILTTIDSNDNQTYKMQTMLLVKKFISDYVNKYNMNLLEMAKDSNIAMAKDSNIAKFCNSGQCVNQPTTFGHIFFYYLLTHGKNKGESYFKEIVGKSIYDIKSLNFQEERILLEAPNTAYKIISHYGARQYFTPYISIDTSKNKIIINSKIYHRYWIGDKGFLKGQDYYGNLYYSYYLPFFANILTDSRKATLTFQGPGYYYEQRLKVFQQVMKNKSLAPDILYDNISSDDKYIYIKNLRMINTCSLEHYRGCQKDDQGYIKDRVVEFGNLAIPYNDNIKKELDSYSKNLSPDFKNFLNNLADYQAIDRDIFSRFKSIKEFLFTPITVHESELVYDRYLVAIEPGKIFKNNLNISRNPNYYNEKIYLTRLEARDDIVNVFGKYFKYKTSNEYFKQLNRLCSFPYFKNYIENYLNTFCNYEKKLDNYSENSKLLMINKIVRKLNMDDNVALTRFQFYQIIYNAQNILLRGK